MLRDTPPQKRDVRIPRDHYFMAQNGTAGYKRQRGLTLKQQNAIELLVMGETDAATAETVGVHRVTVTKWRLYDPFFAAELNGRRKEVWNAATDRLRSLLPLALDALAFELQNGRQRGRTALEVLRIAGLEAGALKGGSLGTYGIGEDDADAMIERAALARRIDPFDALGNDAAVTDLERQSVIDDLEARLADA
jgi:hypothetical protein